MRIAALGGGHQQVFVVARNGGRQTVRFGALNGLSRPIGGCILALECIKVAQSIEHFPVLLLR